MGPRCCWTPKRAGVAARAFDGEEKLVQIQLVNRQAVSFPLRSERSGRNSCWQQWLLLATIAVVLTRLA